ncbi:MAG: protein-glutamate O-methyltransferase CheR, partial [Spirochaetes bacterium]|nr:protein-glutamate O-methyltransferase CheR [Spirochaetota bacterium]
IIFCRNVMIYFDRSRQKELIANFYNILNPWGYLFIGHSETLHALSDDFQYVKIMDSPVYVPKEKV